MLRRLHYLILALLSSYSLHSQSVAAKSLKDKLSFHRITTEQGLPSDIIHCIYQDEKGFIWLGSSNGLCRYDGSRMIVYQHNPKDSFSISDNDILSITSHSSGKLAIGTYGGGVNILDQNINQFINSHNQKNNPVFVPSEIHTIAAIDTSHLAITNGQLKVLDIKNRRTELIEMPANKPSGNFDDHTAKFFSPYRIFIDREKKWWLAGEVGVVVYDPATKKSNVLGLRKDAVKGLKDFSNYSCREDKNGNIWIGGGGGLFEYDKRSDKLIQHYPNRFLASDCRSSWVTTILIKEDNSIWFGTENGLFHYYPGLSSYTVYRNDPNESGSISNNNINNLFEDKQHIIWIATENGLNTLYPTASAFKVYQNLPGDNNSIQTNITKASFKDDDGNIWIGTDKGLECIEATGSVKHFSLPGRSKDSPDNTIMPMLQNDNSSIWIGTWGKGLYLFDFKKREFIASYRFISNGPKSICSNHIHSLCKDNKGNVWIATWNGGIDKFDPVKKTFEHFNTLNRNSGVNSDYLTKVVFACNTIWTGSPYGLLGYDERLNKFHFYRTTNDTISAFATSVNDIIPEDDNNLLLSTAYGLTRFNVTNGHFEKIDIGPGFNMVMHKQSNDSIWLATSTGLKLYVPSKKEITVYSLKDGLPISYFPGECFFHETKDGEIFLSSNNGLIHFYPHEIKSNTTKGPLYITSIKIGNSDMHGDISNLSFLKLKYYENYLRINFATLNFINSSQNQYAYKLENIDKDWVYAGNRNEVIYPSLPSGNYILKIKASNDAGLWNEKELALNIFIETPWWKTWWFYSLCALLMASLVYVFYRIRINRILAEQKLRNKIARDLHDDIGSTLSGIKLFSTMAQNKLQQERSSAIDIVERIGERSEKMMEAMGDIVWSINPANDTMEKMLVRMKQYAAEMLEPKNINYSFSVNEKCLKLKMDSEPRKNIYLIFKETINNAVKYSQCSNVDIKIDCRDKQFEIMINDNGKGFDISKTNGNGNGLVNLQQRAKDLGGKILITSEKAQGTQVNLIVPVT